MKLDTTMCFPPPTNSQLCLFFKITNTIFVCYSNNSKNSVSLETELISTSLAQTQLMCGKSIERFHFSLLKENTLNGNFLSGGECSSILF